MAYTVKETFYTLQGEGAQTGRPAVFCRFAGCNLWSGREADRAEAACRFCDTDFVGTDGPGGGRFETAEALAHHILGTWKGNGAPPFVVFTGGEPLLQLDQVLVDACHEAKIEISVETNGTRPAPAGIDWICVSPKPRSTLLQTSGDELKLVFPQPEFSPDEFEDLDFARFSLQPMDGPDLAANTAATVDYCKRHPHWQLSLQTHKLLGIP
jgi:7-carboxy-7-deazaguanine synthase (Cx14CxxC type)